MAETNYNMTIAEDRGQFIFKNNSSVNFQNTDELVRLLSLIKKGLLIMPMQIKSLEDQKAQIDFKIEEIKADIEDKKKREEVITEFLVGKGLDVNAELDKLAQAREQRLK